MNIQLFNVAPAIPPQLSFLETLASNMWWCWNPDAIDLFRRINPQLWREAGHNPLEFLALTQQKRFEALLEDDSFLRHLAQVRERFTTQVQPPAPGPRTAEGTVPCIAYFSLEYGIHESVKLYSGGLGVLSGDHLKAASDLGVPLVAVGLLYRQGYLQQYLNSDGWQQEHYPENEIHRLPVTRAVAPNGQPVQIGVPMPEGMLHVALWRMNVGRVPLLLLDANLAENPQDFRDITARLYGGDRRVRLRQELLLGIGGVRALLALGYEPRVSHINEGHAAFLTLARVEHLMQIRKLDLATALEVVPRTNVFSTHTPVPAGNETFPIDLLRPHLDPICHEIGIPVDEVIRWGQAPDGRNPHELSMTILGLRLSQFCNGVSSLHGEVARRMWSHLWPGLPEDEIPIRHITNGIHVASWLSPDNATLYDRYLGAGWREHPASGQILPHIAQIPDEELWRAHELSRARLVRNAREILERQCQARNASRAEIAQVKSALDYDALTIGFARRFATYKRAALILKNIERLEALLSNDVRPVQIIFAGKAHPADDFGKDLIRQVIQFARRPSMRRHVVFLENYDTATARYLTQGVDVWLNTPRRPQEASGTSGMKAAINGALHVSVLDGWWCEGYSPDCGWAIGHGEEYDDAEYQDTVESQALYNILENEIIPLFYDRPQGDVPSQWLKMMKASIKMSLGYFTSHRMVAEYETFFYEPAVQQYDNLLANDAQQARQLVRQHARLRAQWHNVRVRTPICDREISSFHVGDTFRLSTDVFLGDLKPDEVDVQVYYGPVDSRNRITRSHVERMSLHEDRGNGHYGYQHEINCRATGRYGFTTRVTPHGNEWKHIMPGFVTWADGAL